MAATVGPAGTLRTRAPVPACRHSALERLAHRAEPLGADVVDGRTGRSAGPPARVGEVGGVDELVDVVAGAENRHGRPSAIQSNRIPKIPSRP